MENAGRLVPKDELIQAIWPDVVVTDESLTRCVSDVRLALQDTEQRIVKTMPRRGYLFASPVLPVSKESESAALVPALEKATALRLSIVVLPFVNLGGDEEEYFVDAITEMLTIDLSHLENAFVISSNTALTYKGRATDARRIGRELGVRFVMQGSVQIAADRVRVSAQLVDAENGGQLWADRFEKHRADIFDMQDEITARLARVLGVELVAAEARRAERLRPNNMDAADLAMRGWAIVYKTRALDSRRHARELFEASLRLDDNHVPALCGVAQMLLHEIVNGAADNPADQLRIADALSRRAVSLAPANVRARISRSMVLSFDAPIEALQECERAIALHRNHPWAHAWAGLLKAVLGRPEETEAHVVEAIRLSPRDPGMCEWLF